MKLREAAARKLAHTQRRIERKILELSRLATSLRTLERRAARYAKLTALSDAEVFELQMNRSIAAKKANATRRTKRRGIELKEGGVR